MTNVEPKEKASNHEPTTSPILETNHDTVKSKKKKNRNGKVGINKSSNYDFVPNAPRKVCQNCNSSNHLTHLCKKPVKEEVCKQAEQLEGSVYPFCDQFDCMACNKRILASCIGLRQGLRDMCIKEVVEESSSTVKTEASVHPRDKKKNEKGPKDKKPTNINAKSVENVDSTTFVKNISGKKKVGAQTQVWVAKPK